MSTVLEDREPFKTVLGYGTLVGEDGRPMHKSWGNAIEFNEGADKIGVDVMRWMYARQNPADNMLFGYKVADETRRRFYLKLWNVYNFFVTYANIDGWRPTHKPLAINHQSSILDRWILTRLNNTAKVVSQQFEEYDAFNASGAIEELVDDLSNWYVRRSRDRVGLFSEKADREAFYQTCYSVLVTLAKLMAPITPFISELIYTNLTKEESVHLADWPKVDEGLIDTSLEEEQVVARQIVELAHSQRKEAGIALRQALAGLVTTTPITLSEATLAVLAQEVNVLKVTNKKGELSAKLDLKLTPELEKLGKVRELVRMIQGERKNLGTSLDEKVDAVLPEWPEEYTEEIKKKALVRNLTKGEFAVHRVQ